MKANKRWNRWEIVYRVPGYNRTFSEHFATEEEANLRIAEIELASYIYAILFIAVLHSLLFDIHILETRYTESTKTLIR